MSKDEITPQVKYPPHYCPRKAGERIRHFRKYRDLKPKQLSQLMGVSHSVILKIEQGKYPVSITMLINLSQRLGANINWLLTGSESMVKENMMTCNMSCKPDENLTLNETEKKSKNFETNSVKENKEEINQ